MCTPNVACFSIYIADMDHSYLFLTLSNDNDKYLIKIVLQKEVVALL